MSVAMLVGLLFLQLPSAWAHAQVSGTFPKNNEVLSAMPSQIWFEFDGNLTEIDGANVNTLLVKNALGKTVQVSKVIVAGARIIATIADLNTTGKITASYRVVSEDGHPVEGSLSFMVQGENSKSPEASTSPSIKAAPEKTKQQVASSKSAEPSPSTSNLPAIVDVHAHHNFLQRHTDHLIEFGVGFAILGIWFIYDRRRKK